MRLPKSFKAVLATDPITRTGGVVDLDIDDLSKRDLLVKVEYSSINYKDGLAFFGDEKIVKTHPLVLGVDLAGEVIASSCHEFKPGDKVVAMGHGLGEKYFGGLAEFASIDAAWAFPLPNEMSTYEAMVYGTAGITAQLCVDSLLNHGIKTDGLPIAVSGGTGGVGSVAIALLNSLGYNVTAISRKTTQDSFLKKLGATDVIGNNIAESSKSILLKRRFQAAVDTVGGRLLADIIRSVNDYGAVACCGNVAGSQLDVSLMPFILRGISLLGVESINTPKEIRENAFRKLKANIKSDIVSLIGKPIELKEIATYASMIVKGEVSGRIVVKL